MNCVTPLSDQSSQSGPVEPGGPPGPDCDDWSEKIVYAGGWRGRLGPDGPCTLLKQFPIEKDIQVTKNKLKKTETENTVGRPVATDGLIN